MTTITPAQITEAFGHDDLTDLTLDDLFAEYAVALQERADRTAAGLDTTDQQWAVARYRTAIDRRS